MRKTSTMIGHARTALTLALVATVPPTASWAQVWQADQGDGTYRNPILFADYPDPDIIRVGSDYYFASTTFANVPGITLLHSKDLVNWRIAGHVLGRLDGSDAFELKNGGAYRHGFYAASLRFHDGMFYIAVTPVGMNTRIYRAPAVTGPWTYRQLNRQAFDPALFFDDDGTGYIATSEGSDGTLTLLTLDKDYGAIETSKVVYYNKGAEGSHIIKRNGWYYLFNAIPGKLAMTVSRARGLSGPWETRPQIDDTTGGHQGALVDLPDGSWYGFVMVDAGSIGRVTNLSPVFWQDDWPVWGTPQASGRVPSRAAKPVAGYSLAQPASSDDFSGTRLGLQWQWNHNPDDNRWSLTERPGFLRLHATPADTIWSARNTLTQKGQGPRGRGIVKLDIGGVGQGDHCGFGTFGKISAQLTVAGEGAGKRSLALHLTDATAHGPETHIQGQAVMIHGTTLWMRTDMDFTKNLGQVAYSLDGTRWLPVGGDFPLAYDWRTGTFQGEQFAISCFNVRGGAGHMDVDSFTLSPLPGKGPQ